MSSVSERLEHAMHIRKVRQIDLANRTGIGKSSISTYLTGAYVPKQTNIYKLASALDVNPAWLMGEDVPMDPLPSALLPASVRRISAQAAQRIPMIGEIAAGIPIVAEQDYETFVDCPMKADFALTVRGNSMEPTFLDGDVVYLREQPDVDEGQIAAVIVDDSATLKHVYHDPNGLTLISENRSYPPMHYTSENSESLRILGLVVGYTRMFKPSPLKGVSKGMPKK